MLACRALGRSGCRNRFGLCGFIISVLLTVTVTAATSEPLAGRRESFDVWQLQENAESPITTILQSSDGYLWLGTYHGLVRFDGVRSVTFDSGNSPGLQNGLITSLYESSDGVLWIGHETGQLTRMTAGRFEPVTLGRAWPGGTLEAITADEEGSLWLLNDSGVLFRLLDGKTAAVPGGASPIRKAVIARSAGGKPWIVCGGKIAQLDRGRIRPCVLEGDDSSNYFERILPARDGGLWVLANQRLRKWRDGHWVAEAKDCPRTPGAVSSLLEMRSGSVLAGTLRDGLFMFTPSGETLHFSRTNGLSHDWVRALCEDHEGNIWVGTAAGLNGVRERKVAMLAAPDAFQGCGVLSVTLSANGSIWAGTEGAGLYHFEDGLWTAFNETNGISNPFVWSVFETREKQLYVGTFGGGLFIKNGARFESPTPLNKITSPVVSLYQGHQGELWIGTTAGLYRYQSGELSYVAGKEKLAFPDVRAITEGVDGTLWLGLSGGGLASLRRGVIKQFTKRDGLGSDFVICLFADDEGTLWMGSSDGGLTRYKNGKFISLGLKQGLPSTIICQLTEDPAGYLWAGSHAGILRASKMDLNRCADGQIPSVHWLGYGKAEGLTSQACSGGFQPAVAQTGDGRVLIPTTRGLAVVDPANVSTNNAVPPVIIEEMSADGLPIELSSTHARRDSGTAIEIPPGRQTFEIRYTGLSFTAPDKVRFKYRLSGLEEKWIDAGSKRVAEYSYLRPGQYGFQVLACNNDGLWNEQGASLNFTILPYFWQTWWFEAGSSTSLAAGLAGFVFWGSRRRVRRKLELSERQRAIERERARIARDIHDDLGASLTRITMLSQSVRSELETSTPATADVDQIYSTARELTRAMDEIVWAVNPKHDTLDSLVTYLGRFAQQFLSSAGLRCRLDVPVYLPALALTSEIRHNVFLAMKEALNNVVKHAAATEVRLSLQLEPNGFVLLVADNGRGFSPGPQISKLLSNPESPRLNGGNGLANMQKRLEEIGGRCECDSAPGEGTRIKFVVKTHDT